VFPPYILSPEYPEFLGRARGPLLSPIGNGILFGACAAAALLLWTRLGRWGKAALTPVILLMLGGAYLTLTRSVWMGVGLGLMLVAALCTPAAWRKTLVAGSLLAALLVAATQWENLLSFKRDKALSAEEMAESARLRPILATVAWKMFLDRPLWGCGLGRYGEASKEYFSDRSTDLPLEKARPFVQHNVLLALLTETGLIGMGLFAVLLGLWARDAWRLWRSPPGACDHRQLGLLFLAAEANYLVNGMFHDVAIIPMVNMVLFFLAGMSAGSWSDRRSGVESM
jgi:O-antigen ligase